VENKFLHLEDTEIRFSPYPEPDSIEADVDDLVCFYDSGSELTYCVELNSEQLEHIAGEDDPQEIIDALYQLELADSV
jgi:hypothetical protein